MIKNDALERKRKKQRIVEECTEKDFYCCGKKVNKNVWELQQLYKSTQAKTTKVLPEFVERIRFMVVKGICKATRSNQVDQNGELFNVVLEALLNKIVPKFDSKTNTYITKYDSTKANLGAYILNSCYWSVVTYQNGESWYKSLLSSSEYLENYDEASEMPKTQDVEQFKLIKNYDENDELLTAIQKILRGDSTNEN